MQLRKIATIAITSGTFGGVIGALATAATQSEASPTAIIAAAVRVSDFRADRTLANIDTYVQAMNQRLGTLDTTLSGSDTSALYSIEANLEGICLSNWEIAGASTNTVAAPIDCQIPAIVGLAKDRANRTRK